MPTPRPLGAAQYGIGPQGSQRPTQERPPGGLPAGTYTRPGSAPPSYAAPAPPTGGGPQMGDIDPNSSLRLGAGGQWLPQNFFSDLTGGGGGGGAPAPAPAPTYAGLAPAAPGQMPLTPGAPQVGRQPWLSPGTYPGIEMPDQMYGFIPQNLRSQFAQLMPSFLGQQGYQGLGNIGQYGERSFGRPGGQGPINFTPEMFSYFTDPTLRNWMQWLFGERGLSSQVPFPQ